VVISDEGYIITNLHVIEGGSKIEVTFSDKREYEARTIGVDPNTDLALLKVNARDLPTLSFGDSDDIRVGEWVLAIGNPFNLASTVTAGIVSAKARNINILRDAYAVESFIQTDAVVNPGNSGGALINSKGELIGINTAIISETGGYEGYSFAIPANLVRKVVSDLRTYGSVRRALLGVNIADVDSDLANSLGLPSVAGVLVRGVTSGSSAEEAGLKAWDVIVSINGQPTTTVPELQEQIARLRPGDVVSVEYYRDGELKRQRDVKLKGLTRGREN
jgi:S1-C subfamily serine protease